MHIDETYLEQRFGVKPRRKTHRTFVFQSEVSGRDDDDFNSESSAVFKKIQRLVAVRDRSINEIENRLIKEDFSPDEIDNAIKKALRCNVLNDERFADTLIRSRLSQGRGVDGIKRELAEHCIDSSIYEPLFDEYLDLYPSEFSRALNALMRKPPRAKNKQQAAYSKLMRIGFSSAIASAAAREWADVVNSKEA